MAGATALRKTLLCPWRHGEPYQGAVLAVCRSHQRRNDARQPIANVLFSDRLSARRWIAAGGFNGDRHGSCSAADDSVTTFQDRRKSAHHGTQDLDLDGEQLSSSASVSSCLGRSSLLISPSATVV